jgi:hypothetical protein
MEEEGIVGLAYYHLHKFSSEVSPVLLQKLKRKTFIQVARQEKIMNQMSNLAKELARENLRWVIIKGLSLALTIYPEPYWRPFFDVDIIVHPEDGQRLDRLLISHNLFCEPDLSPGPILPRELTKREFWLYRPLYRQEELILEVHLGFPLLHSSRQGEEDFWNSREGFFIRDQRLPRLSPEYELALLSLHLQQHSYSRLIWMTDIVQFIQSNRLNWTKLEEIAVRENIKASLGYTFLVINQLWPESVPAEIVQRFSLNRRECFWFRFFFPLEPIITRERIQESPAHTPTFLKLIGQLKLKTWIKALKDFFFPPPLWVTHYYGLKPWSLKFFRHYLWRLSRPFSLIIKRLF